MDSNDDILSILNFFKLLDDEDSFLDLKKELVMDFNDRYNSFVRNFDFETGIVAVDSFDFETKEMFIGEYRAVDDILRIIDGKVRDIKILLDKNILNLLYSAKDISTYLKNIDAVLIALSKREYKFFPRVENIQNALSEISIYIEVNYNFSSEHNFNNSRLMVNIKDIEPLSYNWISTSVDLTLITLKRLHKLLSEEPKIIDSSETDFINAFTQRKVKNGLKWCITGRNGHYTKQTLFSFIEYLMSNKFIESKHNNANASLAYVFRDNNGNILRNISVSKSSTTKTPTGWDRILDIMDRIDKP